MPLKSPWTPSRATVVVILGVTMGGGMLMAASAVFDLAGPLGVVGLLLLLCGAVTVALVGARYGRATGRSIGGSIWFAIRGAFRWLWFFMP